MRRTTTLGLFLLVVGGLSTAGFGGGAGEGKWYEAHFKMLKKLAGDWTGKEAGGVEAAVNYRVTAGGTAVMETLFPGTPHEMVTMYAADGDDLVLTHYCMLGNQPRMKATAGDGNSLTFKFVSGGNMKPEDPHMHSLKLIFVDETHITAEWALHEGGTQTEVKKFEFARKK